MGLAVARAPSGVARISSGFWTLSSSTVRIRTDSLCLDSRYCIVVRSFRLFQAEHMAVAVLCEPGSRFADTTRLPAALTIHRVAGDKPGWCAEGGQLAYYFVDDANELRRWLGAHAYRRINDGEYRRSSDLG